MLVQWKRARAESRPALVNRTLTAKSLLALTLLLGGSLNAVPGKAGRADDPAVPPPAKNLVVLFSGKREDVAQNWQTRDGKSVWRFDKGVVVSRGSDLATKQNFKDFQLHVEFRVPLMKNAHGQARGNSGVKLLGKYEIQILDSYGITEPGTGDCGALYDQAAPLVNACKPPREWQTYDIAFHAPRFDPQTRALTEPGHVTVLQNGVAVLNAVPVTTPTGHVDPADSITTADPNAPGPIVLQYHNNDVAFRNVWIVPLPEKGPTHYESR